MSIALDGSFDGRTGTGKVSSLGLYTYVSFCKIKVNDALQTCISWLYFRPGGSFYIEVVWISSGDSFFSTTLGWVVMVVNIWASLEGGPVCILATEFNFTEKLAGIPGGGGSKACG